VFRELQKVKARIRCKGKKRDSGMKKISDKCRQHEIMSEYKERKTE
jgi:hypothetical protein